MVVSKTVSFETAALAKEFGFNQMTPTHEELQAWLETKGVYMSIFPEFYHDGINWGWQLFWYHPEWFKPKETDVKNDNYKWLIAGGTGQYGDNGEYPERLLAVEAALQLGLHKTYVYFRYNSIDQFSKLYEMSMNDMIDKLKFYKNELGDWSSFSLTFEQIKLMVGKLGEPALIK